MSLCIRPVIETWGESLTYLSRESSIGELIGELVSMAEGKHSLKDAPLTYESHDYADMNVVWISDGSAFLDFLASTDPKQMLDTLANDGWLSSNDDEYRRQCEDVEDLCKMAESWRKSIDPEDGSLRLYCD